jgi:hypothetical protein
MAQGPVASVSEAELWRAESGLGIQFRCRRLDRRLRFTQHLYGYIASRDLPEGDHGGFVVLPRYRWLGAIRQATGSLRRKEHELKQIFDVAQTIFDSDSGHVYDFATLEIKSDGAPLWLS